MRGSQKQIRLTTRELSSAAPRSHGAVELHGKEVTGPFGGVRLSGKGLDELRAIDAPAAEDSLEGLDLRHRGLHELRVGEEEVPGGLPAAQARQLLQEGEARLQVRQGRPQQSVGR
eukprot:CAMPEP_0117685362 /NCGR_PEP_ID=MMETSP0804-20121206/21690_1 /TAXON_ID=1074897 /ORGANISM="Tetraselmis astigmatica, Strain CCMP880" /LENGTH=115 /DNA_ID=CAMNT_0005496611 /DNA_START=439 /DNA_END=786 /DNA_ORIENTATION=-